VVNGFENLENLPVIVIAEGYSTAATLYKALGYSTIVAFDNGNLLPVAKALREKYPDKRIIIAGDDDRQVKKMLGTNPGRERACEAAVAVGGTAVFPVFAQDEMEEDSKRFTDWNDLANTSRLGYSEFLRQVQDAFSQIH
jgi:putative DNA primase/helicase